MVYESDFYTTRRPYSRPSPSITSYTVTTPRHYVVLDAPDRPRRAEEQYSYSYSSKNERESTSGGSRGPPTRNYSSSSERVSRSTGSGPSNTYQTTTERVSRSSDYPGSYNHSYSSTSSGRLPHASNGPQEIDSGSWSQVLSKIPGIAMAHTYHPSIPYIAHKRLNYAGSTPPLTKVKNAALYAELDRINHRVRPHLSYVPSEDFLNSRPIVNFDDEARSIRAQTAALLKRVHTPIPRAVRPLPISGNFDHVQTAIPERITSDDYIHLMIDSKRYPLLDQGVNEEGKPKLSIGKGHLACMSYAGGRGYPRRKYLISPEEREEQRHIKDEILYRSYYDKFRSTSTDSNTGTGGENKGILEHVVS